VKAEIYRVAARYAIKVCVVSNTLRPGRSVKDFPRAISEPQKRAIILLISFHFRLEQYLFCNIATVEFSSAQYE
jgi:hypothetical protein